jgi:hypothetical protein
VNDGLDRRDGGLRGRGGIEARFDTGKGAAARGIVTQTFPADGEEGLGKGRRNLRFAALRSIPDGRMLCQSFNKKDAERPDIGRGSHI